MTFQQMLIALLQEVVWLLSRADGTLAINAESKRSAITRIRTIVDLVRDSIPEDPHMPEED